MNEDLERSEYLRLRNIIYKGKDIEPGLLPPGSKTISEEDAERIYESNTSWSQSPNIAGFGAGPRINDDLDATEEPGEWVLRVYVKEVFDPPSENPFPVPEKIVVPSVGFKRDEFFLQEVEIGDLRLIVRPKLDCPKAQTDPWAAHRNPLGPGTFIGIIDPISYSGTLGCFVKSTVGPAKKYLLSNSHVIANYGKAAQGTVVNQPALWTNYGVAELSNAYPVEAGKPSQIDAAVAEMFSDITFANTFLNLGAINGVSNKLYEGQEVIKSGATSEITCGQVLETDAIVIFDWPDQIGFGKPTHFENQILVKSSSQNEPFSQAGDSGSLLMTRTLQALGLLMGETDLEGHKKPKHPVSVCNNIKIVLEKMKLELL